MNGVRNTYLVLVFASMLVALFVIERDIYHAWKEVNEDGAVQGEVPLIIPNANYFPTLSRKLLAFGDYNGSHVGNADDYYDDDGTGSGSNAGLGSDSGSGPSSGLGSDFGSTTRIGAEAGCSKGNILVGQGATSPLPNGIPTYTVQIENVCLYGGCSISHIHLSCGWFSSARLINPKVFRRLGYDDCLVNDGAPLNPGDCVSFQYANTYPYPLSVSSVAC